MIIPTKHEVLNKNILVIGAAIIELLLEQKRTIEDLQMELDRISNVDVDAEKLLDTLTFLYAADLVNVNEGLVRANYDIPKKYLF